MIPEPLEWGQTYYWRVDEITEAGIISEGKIWTFTVADHLVIDDLESYDDQCNRIFFTWIDGFGHSGSVDCQVQPSSGNGTGSTVGHINPPFAEQQIVHAGLQSMPLVFDNTKAPFYSETTREWSQPQDWTRHGVGTLCLYFRGHPVGLVQTASDSIVLSGIGTDIWGTMDQFRFAYRTLKGNGSIIARVDSVEQTDPWVKAGVMIREDLTASSAWAAVFATGANGVRFQARLGPGASATSDSTVATPEQMALRSPVWIKIERIGDEFRGYYSLDGNLWTPMAWNPQTVTMGQEVFIGLAVTSHNASVSTTAHFSGIATTGNVTGAWDSLDIGSTLPTPNAADSIYLAVEDTSNRVAIVKHPDPAATTLGRWTEWRVPLSLIGASGVDLAHIKRLTLGIGDRSNPHASGTGMLYIDDIRLYRR